MARFTASSSAFDPEKVCAASVAAATTHANNLICLHHSWRPGANRESDFDALPATPAEYHNRYHGEHRFGGADGQVHASRSEPGRLRQAPRQRNLEYPIATKVDPCGSRGVAGAIERLLHDHAPGIKRVAEAHVFQARDGDRNHSRIDGKPADEPSRRGE